MATQAKVILADSQYVVREGLKKALRIELADVKMFEADSQTLLLSILNSFDDHSDVWIIADIPILRVGEKVLTQVLRSRFPGLKVLVHSKLIHPALIDYCINCGVRGYVSYYDDELPQCFAAVAKGQYYLSRRVETSFNEYSQLKQKERPINFSKKEQRVLTLLAAGAGSQEISEELGLSKNTIDTHRKRMLKKFKVANVAALIHFAHLIGEL